MDREFGLGLIDKSSFGVLSMVSGKGESYGVPLSLVRDGDVLYFHSAAEGKKVKALEGEPTVSIAFVGEVRVPENFSEEELAAIARDEKKVGLLLSSVFTTEFESAIVSGRVENVETQEEKIKAMRLICEKYTPTKMAYFPMAVKAGLPRVRVYKIKIAEITAKRKKYDLQGKEMKWGRME